jgi:molybdenum cofactor biosynthesis protein B
VTPLLERRLDGFGELFRALSFEQIGAAALLSRAVAGTTRGRAIVLPGSPAAVEPGLSKLVLPVAAHLVGQLRRAR